MRFASACRPFSQARSCVRPVAQRRAHPVLVAASRREAEIQRILSTPSQYGTPIVDFLLADHKGGSGFFSPEEIERFRNKELSLSNEEPSNRIRRLRIGFANKRRAPWNLGVRHSPETVNKIRKSVTQVMRTDEMRQRMREKALGQTHTAETRKKIRSFARIRHGHKLHLRDRIPRHRGRPSCTTTGQSVFHTDGAGKVALAEYGRPHWPGRGEYRPSAQLRAKAAQRRRKLPAEELARRREVKRQRIAKSVREKWKDPEFRARTTASMSEATTRKWQDPAYRARKLESMRSNALEMWQDSEYREKQARARARRTPAKPVGTEDLRRRERQRAKSVKDDKGAKGGSSRSSASEEGQGRRVRKAQGEQEQRRELEALEAKQMALLRDRVTKLRKAQALVVEFSALIVSLEDTAEKLQGQPMALERVQDAISKARRTVDNAASTAETLEALIEEAAPGAGLLDPETSPYFADRGREVDAGMLDFGAAPDAPSSSNGHNGFQHAPSNGGGAGGSSMHHWAGAERDASAVRRRNGSPNAAQPDSKAGGHSGLFGRDNVDAFQNVMQVRFDVLNDGAPPGADAGAIVVRTSAGNVGEVSNGSAYRSAMQHAPARRDRGASNSEVLVVADRSHMSDLRPRRVREYEPQERPAAPRNAKYSNGASFDDEDDDEEDAAGQVGGLKRRDPSLLMPWQSSSV